MIDSRGFMKIASALFWGFVFLSSCQNLKMRPHKAEKDQVKANQLFNSSPNTARYELEPLLIEKLQSGQDLFWGGFSGLSFIEKDSRGNFYFWTMTDRGPNGEDFKKDHVVYRQFIKPDFHPSLLKIKADINKKILEIIEVIPFKDKNGEFMTGLPPANNAANFPRFEIPLNSANEEIVNSVLGIDSESIAVDEKKHFWIGEEYEPSFLEFDQQGRWLAQIKPAAKPNTRLKKNEIPYEFKYRKMNRGFEALSYYKNKIYFMTQSPLDVEARPQFVRIGVFNTTTRLYEAEYLYPLESLKVDKLGDMVMLNDHQFLVIEQNGEQGPEGVHRLFQVEFKQATNTFKKHFKDLPENLKQFPKDFRFADKRLYLDLMKEGYSDFEKVEGLTLIDAETIAVINDNDFGFVGGQIKHKPTVLGIIKSSRK
jgi:3-phytase